MFWKWVGRGISFALLAAAIMFANWWAAPHPQPFPAWGLYLAFGLFYVAAMFNAWVYYVKAADEEEDSDPRFSQATHLEP